MQAEITAAVAILAIVPITALLGWFAARTLGRLERAIIELAATNIVVLTKLAAIETQIAMRREYDQKPTALQH